MPLAQTTQEHQMTKRREALYILTTSPSQEGAAAKELRRLGFDAYAPSIRYQRRICGTYRRFTRAMIPGYIFAMGCEADEPVIRHQARGVTGILAEMDEAGKNWIGSLLLLESFGFYDTTIERKAKIKLGELVRIVTGQWSALGYVGKVSDIKGRKIVVSVNSAHGKPVKHGMPVTCDADAVRLVA